MCPERPEIEGEISAETTKKTHTHTPKLKKKSSDEQWHGAIAQTSTKSQALFLFFRIIYAATTKIPSFCRMIYPAAN